MSARFASEKPPIRWTRRGRVVRTVARGLGWLVLDVACIGVVSLVIAAWITSPR